MAIELPRAGIGSVGTGGRRGRARLPDAGDVPQVRVAGDPGVQVPNFAQDAGGLGDVGAALSDVGERLAAADDRIKTRQESLDRMRLRAEFREDRRDSLQAFSTTEDLSIKGVLEAYGKEGQDKINALTESHQGREPSKLRLSELLESDFAEFNDKAATLSAQAGNARTTQVAGEVISGLEARALLGENPANLIDEGMDQIVLGSELADAMRPGDEINFARLLSRRVMTASIEVLFAAGEIDEVQNVLEDPAVQRALGEDAQRNIFKRLEAARRERAKPRTPITLSPGQAAFDPATGDQIASVPAPAPGEKPVVLSQGQTLVDPKNGAVIASVAAAPEIFRLSPGEQVVDAEGNAIAQAKDRPVTHTLSPGEVVVDAEGSPIAEGPSAPDRATLSPGQVRFEDGEEVASVPAKEEAEPLVEIFDVDSPTKTRFVRESEAAGQPGRKRTPIISITNQSETALAKELGKLDAERIGELEDNAQQAFRTLAEVERMSAAVESGRFTTGVFSDFRVFLSRFATFVGASEETLGLLGDAATADTLDAASNRLGVEAAQKLGRITNMSLQFVRDSLPNLTRTPEGNRILMEVMRRTAEREIQLASLAEDFIQRHNTLRPPDGRTYFQAVRDLEEEDPVITDELRQRIVEGSRQQTKTFKELFGDEAADAPTLSTQEEVDALEPGTEFIWAPSGQKMVKD